MCAASPTPRADGRGAADGGGGPPAAPDGARAPGDPRPGLFGRRRECEALEQLLAGVRAGTSGVLVLRGEAGIGKSALLEHLCRRASGCQVARTAGVESEMELPYAGLHLLCGRMLDRLDRLPEPQREALAVAFGLRGGPPPDRFLVGLAVLGLLSEAAEDRPLICVVDDAQWMDAASLRALAFVARRLLAEAVGIVFARRDPDRGVPDDLAGLPEMMIGGLAADAARRLFDAAVAGPLDETVRDRIVAETRGNPLALLELPRGLTPAQLAGGFGLPAASPLAEHIEGHFRAQLEALPAEQRRLLLTAAAEPGGDAGLVLRAAAAQGIGAGVATAAEATGLIEIGAIARFRHPLVRAAAYRTASREERRAAHRALADAADAAADPDRCAWHRGQAAVAPDEQAAAQLELSAARARDRGGVAAAAAFLRRAVDLTADPARRAARALAAAQRTHQAGAPDTALELLRRAESDPLDEFQRARVERLRAQIAFARTRGSDAPALLVGAARRIAPLDVDMARETFLDAVLAAIFAGRFARDVGLRDVAEAAATVLPAPEPRRSDLLLDGLASLATAGPAAGVPRLRRALAAFDAADGADMSDQMEWLSVACHAAINVWDDAAWDRLSRRHIALAREAGALSALPIALNNHLGLRMLSGDLVASAALVAEARTVSEIMGIHLIEYGRVALAAWRGREAEATALIEACIDDVTARGEGIGLTTSLWARAVLCNGLGRYREAAEAAAAATAHPGEVGPTRNWALPELVEAAVRACLPDTADDALQRLAASTGPSGTTWALGIEARSRALVSDGPTAEGHHRRAIAHLGATRMRVELARAHLLYGEWLRRENRRVDAREHLATAHTMLADFGAEGFAERARRELSATGQTVHRHAAAARDGLTAQELQIARLADEGRTNRQIGAELFLSPRTIEWHMRHVFAKLGISSRRELRDALPGRAHAGVGL